jgi:hypothetical protein
VEQIEEINALKENEIRQCKNLKGKSSCKTETEGRQKKETPQDTRKMIVCRMFFFDV